MGVIAGPIAGYVVVETTAAGVQRASDRVHVDRLPAVQWAHLREDAERVVVSAVDLAAPLSTFKVFALVEVDEP